MRILPFAIAAAFAFAAWPALAQTPGPDGQTIQTKSQTKIQDRIQPMAPDNGPALEKEIARLKEEVASLKAEIASLRAAAAASAATNGPAATRAADGEGRRGRQGRQYSNQAVHRRGDCTRA